MERATPATAPQGWCVVETMMLAQLERGDTRVEDYNRHLSGGDPKFPAMLNSWNYFLQWKEQNPKREVPAWVSRMRTDQEHAAWAADGLKEFASWYDEAFVLGVNCGRAGCKMPTFGPRDWEATA